MSIMPFGYWTQHICFVNLSWDTDTVIRLKLNSTMWACGTANSTDRKQLIRKLWKSAGKQITGVCHIGFVLSLRAWASRSPDIASHGKLTSFAAVTVRPFAAYTRRLRQQPRQSYDTVVIAVQMVASRRPNAVDVQLGGRHQLCDPVTGNVTF
ncbi:hypothetical protein ACI65C_011327 [Semiaphis heraclei]